VKKLGVQMGEDRSFVKFDSNSGITHEHDVCPRNEEEEEGEEAVNKRPAAGFVLPAAKKHKTVAKTTTLKAMKDMLENGTDQATLWRMLVTEHGNGHGALPTQVESYYHKACKAVYGE